jgi:hypothetical protein
MKFNIVIGAAVAVAAIAAPASAETIFGLTATNSIVTFDSAAPGVLTSARPIVGLAVGDSLTGIDLRPSNRTLDSVATSGNLYRINATGGTYTATLIADLGNITGNRYGIDFNPVADRLRFISDFDQNLRINVDTGAVIVDGTISAPGAEAFVGAAYTNNFAGTTTTQLYALDASGNQLTLSTAPNAGTYNDVGVVSGIDFGGTNNVGFDISGATGVAYFSNANQFYTLNLATAEATSVGTIGAGSLIGLTVGAVPEPSTWAMMLVGFGLVGMGARRRRTIVAA